MDCIHRKYCECNIYSNYIKCSKDPEYMCTKNPHRFDSRLITEGQIKCLVSLGCSREDVLEYDYLTACKTISKLKYILKNK